MTPDLPKRFVAYQTLYQRAIRLLLGMDIPDSTYGFHAFNRTFVQALGISGRRLSVCSEMTFKVMLAGGKTVRLPGEPTGPMVREQSKFRLGNGLGGYMVTLMRASPIVSAFAGSDRLAIGHRRSMERISSLVAAPRSPPRALGEFGQPFGPIDLAGAGGENAELVFFGLGVSDIVDDWEQQILDHSIEVIAVLCSRRDGVKVHC